MDVPDFLSARVPLPLAAKMRKNPQRNEDPHMRQVVVHPGEDGCWIAECPSLPGCITQGRTREEALANAKEAIEGYVAALEDDGLPVPEEHFDTLLVAV